MANDWYTSDLANIQKVKKGSLTAWDNAGAKLIAAEVQAIDNLISFQLTEPICLAEPTKGSAVFLPGYQDSRYIPGRYIEHLYLQTGINLYPAMGLCTTADDTPSAGFYTHTMSLRTAQTPLNMGRHLERDNITTAENEVIDLFSMMCQHYHAECSEANQKATQTIDWLTCRTLNTGCDDITPAALTATPYEWNDFTFPTFTYNSETIEANIIGWALDIYNTCSYTGLSSGFYSVGRYVPPTYITVTLQIMPYGRNAFELIRTALSGYATDLALTVNPVITNNENEITFTHDKLYCDPYNIMAYKTPAGVESYFMRMHELSTSTPSFVEINDIDDDYYET